MLRRQFLRFGYNSFKYSSAQSALVENNYWRDAMASLSQKQSSLISRVLSCETNDVKPLISEISTSLIDSKEFRNQKSLGYLLLAIQERNEQKLLFIQEFVTKHLAFFITLSEENTGSFDVKTMTSISKNLTQLILKIDQKNKKMQYKLKLLNLLIKNINVFTNINQLVPILNDINSISSRGFILDQLRFARLSIKIQHLFVAMLKRNHLKISPQRIKITCFLLLKVLNANFSSEQNAEFLLNFIMKPLEVDNKTRIRNSMTAYRFFPNIIPTNEATYKQVCGSYRNRILIQLEKQISQDSDFRSAFINYDQNRYISHAFQMYLSSVFYVYYKKINKIEIEHHQIIKEKVTVPVLDSFGLILYKYYQKKILSDFPLVNIIMQTFYPQHFSQKYSNLKCSYKKDLEPIQNQLNLRISESLDNLSLSYESECEVLGKKVDYLINDNIILQLDGDIHIDFNTMDESEATSFRNILFLCGGYRVIIITINEYNLNRSNEHMQFLIEKKLRILQQNDALLVK